MLQSISVSQFSDLVGLATPADLLDVHFDRATNSVILITEDPPMQTTGTCPPIASNTNYGKGGKSPRKSGGKK